MYVSVLEVRLEGALGVDGGWMPLPTRLQRYCDPASLVVIVVVILLLADRHHPLTMIMLL